MSADRSRKVQELFESWVEERVVRRMTVDPESLCADRPELLAPLRRLIAAYSEVDLALEEGVPPASANESPPAAPLPEFDGLRTIERLGRGGSGEVYKVEDPELGRTLAAKILRADGPLASGFDRFLAEARALALFDDPRIVKVHEFRGGASPPVLLMEYVEGFELGRIAPSLEYAQRARLMAEIADAIQRAHELGLTHRDLKPANVLVDARLSPRILDFGLSSSDPARGHGAGTPAYMAPEQLDADRRIDARTDVYALGVMLYELLCGERPYDAGSESSLLSAIREGSPRLPLEIDAAVPEPLQAIALKAMERCPEARYGSAREMARDLRRWLDGSPVDARPTLYQGALERRVRPHLEQVGEWVRLRLIYPHEEAALTRAYVRLSGRDDDWIVGNRFLSLSSIVLYLGACFLGAGAVLYYAAHSLDGVAGGWAPVVVLALPFVGVNLAAHRLYRRRRRLVAVAYYLAAAVLLPLFLLILLDDLGWFAPAAGGAGELLGEWPASDRRLQLVAAAACAWSVGLATSTRTVALGATATLFGVLFYMFLLTEVGLRGWLDDGAWNTLGWHLLPLALFCGVLGFFSEKGARAWFARPLYPVAAGAGLVALELTALDGKLFAALGISMAPFQPGDVSDPLLLDTLAGMTVVGIACYVAARLLESRGTRLMHASTVLLFVVSPFAILQPLYLLNRTGEYSRRFDWLYLTLSVAMALASHFGQRRSFFYAGVLNTLAAVWLLTSHYEWLDRPAWAVAVVLAGLFLLAGGWALNRREARRAGPV